MNIPANLWLNRHGTWYFRAVIPLHLRQHFPHNKREVRRSLRTDSKRLAIRLARECRVAFDSLLEQLEVAKGKSIRIDWIKDIKIPLPNGEKIEIGEIDQGDPEKEKETIAAITKAAASAFHPSKKEKPDGDLLSKVTEDYCAERVRGGRWKGKTEHENLAIFELLIRIIGDIPTNKIDHAIMRRYKETIEKLPSNMNKDKRYRDNSIEEILALDDVKLMSVRTINKNLTRTSSLFEWGLQAPLHGSELRS